MKERISQLMDGELDERSAADTIKACGQGAEALEVWRTYHLISDAMRDTRVLSAGFAARVIEKISLEPTVLAPKDLQPDRPRNWFAVPAAIAAGLSGVAIVGWLALAPQPQVPQVAQVQVKPQTIPLPSATPDYLLAHQGFSPRLSLQGMSAYARTVSAEASEERK